MMMLSKIFSLLTLAAALLVGVGFARPSMTPVQVVVEPEESRLWIEGTSTVNSWSCKAGQLDGRGHVAPAKQASYSGKINPRAKLSVAVSSFDCGRDRMNEDFYEALHGDKHHEIIYELLDASVVEEPSDSDGWYRMLVTGNLSIAGTTQRVEATVWGKRQEDGFFRVRGSKPLKMTSFGVSPPVALLGLIKADDRIEVHFNLLAAPDSIAGN